MIRLTLDLDDINLGKAKRKYNLLKLLFPNASKYEMRRSAGGKGVHLLVYGAYPSSEEGIVDLITDRISLGDDRKRIIKDFQRILEGLPFNVLFTSKEGKKVKTIITEKWKTYVLPASTRANTRTTLRLSSATDTKRKNDHPKNNSGNA